MPVIFGASKELDHAEVSYDAATDTVTYLHPPGWSRDQAIGYCWGVREAVLGEQIALAMGGVDHSEHTHPGDHVHPEEDLPTQPTPVSAGMPKGRRR